MPELKLASIVSSSEAFEKFEASSLLDSRRHRPFKGRPGVESNVVVIKLAQEDTIRLIDIGNEFTALLEILVSKSCYENPTYSTLLDTKFLMTPEESKKEKNGNKWFRFSKDDFNYPVAENKWDLIKIVCKQTFNSKIPYGLTFISITGGEEILPTNTVLTPLGCALTPSRKFNEGFTSIKEVKRSFFDDIELSLKKEEEEKILSPVSASRERLNIPRAADGMLLDPKGKPRTAVCLTNEKRTEMYDKWKTLKEERNKDIALNAPKNNRIEKRGVTKSEKNQDDPSEKIFYEPEEHETSNSNTTTRNDLKSPKAQSRKRLSDDSYNESNKRLKISASEEKKEDPCTNSRENEKKDRKRKPDPINSQQTPTTKLKAPLIYETNLINPLKDVVLTLSGFQNPLRTQLREKALSLGAAYSNEMTPKVTHIVSAFRNTPKAKQAGPTVFIVSSFWVDRCILERRRLDENLFSLKN